MFPRARLQLAAWYAGFLALTVLVLGVAVYYATREGLDGEIDDSLREATAGLQDLDQEELAAVLDVDPGAVLSPIDLDPDEDDDGDDDDDDEQRPRGFISSEVFVVLTAADGTVLANPRQIDLEDIDFDHLVEDSVDKELQDESGDDERFRFDTIPLDGADFAGEQDLFLHAGRSLDSRDEELRTLLIILVLGGMAGVAFSTLAGFILAGRALIPIRQSFETQQRFISDASHELRTPLTVVKANNEILIRHPEQTIGANMEQVEAVDAEIDQMARLVDDLLTLARADEGKLALQRELIDLSSLLDEVRREILPVAEGAGIVIRSDLAPAHVLADRGRIRQVAVTILDNAIKYTPAGGVITLSCRRAGPAVEFSVRDTGPGIGREHLGRLFDRFYRADAARTRSQGGTGLGLSIASRLVEAHGGRISVDSTPGLGSTFTVRLPARG